MNVEVIKGLIVSAVVAFLGTSVAALIVKVTLNNIINLLKSRVKEAEETNRLGTETSAKVYGRLEIFEQNTQEKIDYLSKLIKDEYDFKQRVNAILDYIEQREKEIAELLEEGFADEEV